MGVRFTMTLAKANVAIKSSAQYSVMKSIIEPRYAIQYNQVTLPALLGSQSAWMKFCPMPMRLKPAAMRPFKTR